MHMYPTTDPDLCFGDKLLYSPGVVVGELTKGCGLDVLQHSLNPQL